MTMMTRLARKESMKWKKENSLRRKGKKKKKVEMIKKKKMT